MRRWIWNLVCAFSLLLCLAAGVEWVRSWWGSDYVQWRHIAGQHELTIWRLEFSSGRVGLNDIWAWRQGPEGGDVSWGFGLSQEGPRWIASGTIPAWHLVVYFGALPAQWTARKLCSGKLLRARRRKQGLCGGCEYDLRESKEKCPECGEMVVNMSLNKGCGGGGRVAEI